ncbi:MAG: hypothetical protein WC119_00750 [Synergistaceae bacterium]
MKFNIQVEKRMYALGSIEVEADSLDEAIQKTDNKINRGELQTTEASWGDPKYEDCSFQTTGDEA